MYYKLSNNASRDTLEILLERPFKYPYLHKKRVLINGFEEATIPIVSMQEKDIITPAIWGILPEGYEDDWSVFQNICNTLNVPLESMDMNLWYAKSLINQRCLIPVTGFFTSYLADGVVYPFHFSQASGLPFCLAGIYTVLEDGFVTAALITCEADDIIGRVHNVGQTMPMLLSKDLHSDWLNDELVMNDIKKMLSTPHNYNIKSHPIAREFYKNNISYDSMLDPVFYDNAPNGLW
jgi:putative SOS response-associated peptidase YedK